MTHQFETGVTALDRRLGGGIPAERMVALVASPSSQSERLLTDLAARYPTTYLTTERPVPSVRSSLREAGSEADTHTVHPIGHDTPVLESVRYVRQLPDRSVFVVDPVDALEAAAGAQYREFLATLRTRLVNTESIAVFHCLDGDGGGPGRDRTTYTADLVFHLDTVVEDDRVENRLAVPKFRGGDPIERAMDLELDGRITVDRSRDIA